MSATLTPLPTPPPSAFPARPAAAKWNILPFPSPGAPAGAEEDFVPKPLPLSAVLPAWPAAAIDASVALPTSWPKPLAVVPFPAARDTSATTAAKPKFSNLPWPAPDFSSVAIAPTPVPSPVPKTSPVATPAEPAATAAELVSNAVPDFTDEDLRSAFQPIVEHVVKHSALAHDGGSSKLEPLLRSTIRRALAEYSPSSRPFQPPGVWDRFLWHIQALFSSRTYEEILFEKTRRVQVEEVYLLDATTLALVSYASCDPARHASTHRVTGTVNRLTLQLRDETGGIRPDFTLGDGRHIVSRVGTHAVLMAVVRGRPGDMVVDDLDFVLQRVEDHFRAQFLTEGSELLHPLQPFLEDCLLIQSPASAA